jgi:hypothetical protein
MIDTYVPHFSQPRTASESTANNSTAVHPLVSNTDLGTDEVVSHSRHTMLYDPALHREALQKAMEEDAPGCKRLMPMGTAPKKLFDAFEVLPDWFATHHVILKNNDPNKPVGIVSLAGLTQATKEISRWIAPEERGTGLAKNAVEEILQLAPRLNPQLQEIRSNPMASNKASVISSERLGFKRDPRYAVTWLAAVEQLVQRASIRVFTGEWADPHAFHFNNEN